jgi:C-terminal processing protease CtpA/Prc
MKNLRQFIWIFIVAALCNVACEKKDDPVTPPEPPENKIPAVSQFVYDGMSQFYLWNEQMSHKEPKISDTDANKYFESVLYSPIDRWSWITDDVNELLNTFSGEGARAYGFDALGLWWDEQRNRLIAFVRYVYPNTPAEKAGFKRGDVIWEIEKRPITVQNYNMLFEADKEVTFTVFGQDDPVLAGNTPLPVTTWDVKITPEYPPMNPVLHSSIHEIDGKKIGYLFYTAYRSNFNNYLYEVFSEFKNKGVTDLVLDLRYNPGGDISAAVYLASMIAPKDEVEKKSLFAIMNYNRFINQEYDRRGWIRGAQLGEYHERFPNPIDANLELELNKVYILATEFSASASELTIFCLRPYVDVVHIGENTSGKYTASWTVHAYDNFMQNGQARAQIVYSANDPKLTTESKEELKNWAMQPIVGRYSDKNDKDFVAAGTLRPDFPIATQEFNTRTWKPIGDKEDYLFAKAISLITGQPYRAATRSVSDRQLINTELRSRSEKLLRRAVNVDNITEL